MGRVGEMVFWPGKGVAICLHANTEETIYRVLSNGVVFSSNECSLSPRDLMGRTEVKSIFMTLMKRSLVDYDPSEDCSDKTQFLSYIKRKEKYDQGLSIDLASIVRDFSILSGIRELSNAERFLFHKSLQFIVEEIAVVTGKMHSTVGMDVDTVLSGADVGFEVVKSYMEVR